MEREEVEVKLSDKITVTIAPLTAFESIQADEISGGGELNEAKSNKVYSICSIRTLNGDKVNPLRNRLEFAAVAQKLNMGELMRLIMEVSKQTASTFDDDLKNELAARSSDS